MAVANYSVEQDLRREIAREEANRRALRIWLGVVLLSLLCIVVVGGATRLTNSGLSITEWKPIHGVIPPLNAAEWEEEFRLYQRIPEAQTINKDMTIEGFKQIFWWEWAHRFIARSVGLIFALPLAFFWVTGRLERRLRLPLFGILLLYGLQGVIGWWMVSSGLAVRTDVSQYRLATHLVTACLIFASCTWIMRGLSPHSRESVTPLTLRRLGAAIAIFCLFQIYLGALVAGLDAGYSYNTWPLMDGALVPQDLFLQQPAWLNLFENPKTVQFMHRLGAYTLFALAFANLVLAFRLAPGTTHARRALGLVLLVTAQAAVGVTTLLMQVPLSWGLLHQAGALVVFGFAIANWRAYVGAYPRATVIAEAR